MGVFTHDAEKEGGGKTAVDGGPGLSCVGRDVLQAEESFDCADQAVDAGLLEGLGKFVAGGAGTDGWSTEFGDDV